MIVTNDVRRPDATEGRSNPPEYAPVPGAANFTTVFHEVNGRGSGTRDTASTRNADAATEPRAGESSTTKSTSDHGKPDENGRVDAATDDTQTPEAENNRSGSGERIDTDAGRATATAGNNGRVAATNGAEDEVADQVPPTTAQSPTPDSGLDPLMALHANEAGPQNATDATAPSPTATASTEETPAVSAAAALLAAATGESRATGHADGAPTEDGSGVAGSKGELLLRLAAGANGESTSGRPPLPRTFNALLAESAVRANTGQTTGQTPAADAPDQIPEFRIPGGREELPPTTPAAPRVAAMDLSGVRTDSTAAMPRLPLSNLPGELAQQIHLMQQEGTKTMRIRIVPEHLGELRIEIQGTGDTLRVRMIAANAAVRDALDSQMGDLKQALQRQGLSLNNASVDTGPNHRETPFRQDRAPGGPMRGGSTETGLAPAPLSPTPMPGDVNLTNALNLLV